MFKYIRIQNYKSLRDVRVELSPLTVLIGKSGTGKSNFVQGIKYFRDLLFYYASKNSIDHINFQYSLTVPVQSQNQSFEICYADELLPGEFKYFLDFTPNEALGRYFVNEESLIHNSEYVFHKTSTISQEKVHPLPGFFADGSPKRYSWIREPAISPLPFIEGISLAKLPGIDFATLAFNLITRGIGIYHFGADVLSDSITDRNNHSNGATTKFDNLSIDEALSNLFVNITMLGRKREIVDALQHLVPSVDSLDIETVNQVIKALIVHKVGDTKLKFEVSQESDGFRRFYAYLLAMSQPPGSLKRLLIFEEPENGIYRGALSTLADFFMEAATDKGLQIILTTHSPDFLDHFPPEYIRVVDIDNMETKIGPLDPAQAEAIREELLYPRELLTVDPARRDKNDG